MFCGNCGTQIPDNSYFCANCGWQRKIAPSPTQVNKKSKKPIIIALVSIFSMLIIVTIAFLAYFFSPKQQALRTFNQFANALADEDYDKVEQMFFTDNSLDMGFHINEQFWYVLSDSFSEGYEILCCEEVPVDVADANFHIINQYFVPESDDVKEAFFVFFIYEETEYPVVTFLVYKVDGEWLVDTGSDRF